MRTEERRREGGREKGNREEGMGGSVEGYRERKGWRGRANGRKGEIKRKGGQERERERRTRRVRGKGRK